MSQFKAGCSLDALVEGSRDTASRLRDAPNLRDRCRRSDRHGAGVRHVRRIIRPDLLLDFVPVIGNAGDAIITSATGTRAWVVLAVWVVVGLVGGGQVLPAQTTSESRCSKRCRASDQGFRDQESVGGGLNSEPRLSASVPSARPAARHKRHPFSPLPRSAASVLARRLGVHHPQRSAARCLNGEASDGRPRGHPRSHAGNKLTPIIHKPDQPGCGGTSEVTRDE